MADDVGGAQGTPEPLLKARVVVACHRNGALAVGFDDLFNARGDVVQRFVPGDFLKFSFTALAHAL